MFGRRRHVAAVPAAPVPQLTDAQILELVHAKMAELIGENGEWTVIRRAHDDTDAIFHSILAQSVSVGITAAIAEARRRLEAGEALSEPQHLAPAVADEHRAASRSRSSSQQSSSRPPPPRSDRRRDLPHERARRVRLGARADHACGRTCASR